MFGKLLLKEIKGAWRVPVILAGVMLVLTGIASLEIHVFLADNRMYNEIPGIIRAVMIIFLILYFLFLVVANSMVALYVPVRFYKQSYSDIGYLTHSLPVSKGAILMSHVVSGLLWMAMIGAVDALAFGFVAGQEITSDFFRFLFGPLFREIRSFMRVAGSGSVILIIVGVAVMLLTPVLTVLQGCCAVSLGQMFEKHRVAGAVVMYFVLNFLTSMINQVFTTFMTVTSNLTDNYDDPRKLAWYLVVVAAGMLLIEIVECIIFTFLSINRMTKTLNLE